MLFDINPKERREDLYDREGELGEVVEALRLGERLVVIYGMRRVGKSSVLRVALKEAEIPHVIIDVKGVYAEHGSVSRPSLYNEIADFFTRNMGFLERVGFNLREVLRRIRGFHVSSVGVEVEPTVSVSLTKLLRRIDDWCGRHGMRFALAFDEAQYLRYGGGVRYDALLAWCVDNLRNITVIVTGSEVGVLREFLKVEDPGAPLFSRYRREVRLDRFSREQSIGFLQQGFTELGVGTRVSEVEEVINILDGVVGWLTHYGYYRAVRKLPHRKAVAKVFKEGSKLVLEELERLIAPSRERYAAILKAVAHEVTTWSDIKAFVTARTGYVNDKRFTELLKNLVKYGYLTKRNGRYEIPDPIVKEACKHL